MESPYKKIEDFTPPKMVEMFVYSEIDDKVYLAIFGKLSNKFIDTITGKDLDNVTHWAPFPLTPKEVEKLNELK